MIVNRALVHPKNTNNELVTGFPVTNSSYLAMYFFPFRM